MVAGGWPTHPGMTFQGYMTVIAHKDGTFDLQKSRVIKSRIEAERCAGRWKEEFINGTAPYRHEFEIVIRELFYRARPPISQESGETG